MVKLIQETDVFGIQSGHSCPESSEFVDLFAKSSVIMNIRMPLNNYKKCAKEKWDQSKDGSNMFEADKGNANVKKNNGVIIDFDYNSNSI